MTADTRHATRFGPLVEGGQTTFRLWAPSAPSAELVIKDGETREMQRASDGFFELATQEGPGSRYKFKVGDLVFPDIAARQQDEDADGWSIVCERVAVEGSANPVRPWHETVICEVHIGTVTPEGTFKGLADRLEHFRSAGFTALELMPINEFPGRRNWGYDGTLIFAPESAYGTPADLRGLVRRAHELGISLILDVVYNHFGSVANFVEDYSPEWFDPSIETPWGPGIDFKNPMVRQFYYENAGMWLSEFGFDGLRFDAIHEIGTEARDQFLGELAQQAKLAKPHARLIIENARNTARWLERDASNEPMTYTAQWNDDIHHVLAFLVSGEGQKLGYDNPNKDPVADLEKALTDGFVHDLDEGTESDGRTRGGPAGQLPPDCFITYVENHDQIGNRADGRRLSTRVAPNRMDFIHFVKFIAPQVPLCFMGDEANLRSPFPFFVDLSDEDGRAVDGRRYKEMREQFNEDVADGSLPHPNDPDTFEMAKLPWDDMAKQEHEDSLARFRQLAAWRRDMLWPLAGTPCIDARGVRHDRCLIVTWQFEAGLLSLALNPGDAPMDIPCVITGAPVSTGDFHQHGDVLRLGPWSAVAWRS